MIATRRPAPADATAPSPWRRPAQALQQRRWLLLLVGGMTLLTVQRLVALGSVPPGLTSDEASVGYNAWALAHHGVDEHGVSFPLFLQAFNEYKSPVYVYLLAPFTWVLPLSAATVRLPAALMGIAVVALLGATAWSLTRSRVATALTMTAAALTPWAVLMARVGVEAPAMVLCLTVALWCVARAERARTPAWWRWGAGVALAASIFSYPSARLLAGLLVAALCVGAARRTWRRVVLPLALPVAAGYVILGAYGVMHPAALFNRLAGISIASDHPGPLLLVARFARNYLTYTGLPFLASSGDSDLRYSSGHQGMLLVCSLPFVVLGIGACIARRQQMPARLVLAGLLLAPVPAALTDDGTPQALRACGMLPFALAAAAYGFTVALPWLRSRRALCLLVAAAAVVESGAYLVDLYSRYPGRALATFDSGEVQAIADAHRLAAGHRVLLSTSLDQGYIEALFALQAPPPIHPLPATESGDNRAYHDAVLAPLRMAELTPAQMDVQAYSGDLFVLAAGDQPPPGATLVERVTATADQGDALRGGGPAATVLLASVWRR